MNVFFAYDLSDSMVSLSPEESHHCVRVLRNETGNMVHLIDGKGTVAEGKIVDAHKAKVSIEIIRKALKAKHPYYLHVAIAPTKANERFEWFLEKAVELGVDEITPILTHHSERKKINAARYQKVILSATKQSLNPWLPQLNPLSTLDELIRNTGNETYSRFMCTVDNWMHGLGQELEDVKGSKFLGLIGPEGGFSEQETVNMRAQGYNLVHLGTSRLRTETAGVFVCAILRTLNLDL
ncbi:MAG: 16S rRNA (uracil(1498)-N(3))-methyltransferase [Saprospiraceae bacterium]|nr:16S rRNA (uracil(1498)-N(3))-methyltransferase [Saprospiraceae bacterium]